MTIEIDESKENLFFITEKLEWTQIIQKKESD